MNEINLLLTNIFFILFVLVLGIICGIKVMIDYYKIYKQWRKLK